ncbi:InlB B-repeat-containing protein [[Clostridium] polysaccharolyticum]|uniref:Listeria/Bacterioides repeat-containing protein n=1 Tax=[Clostridium] polysaccharolyticum TaxID=29364 RepID=A0A1I0EGI5_9FIRM|nr:InlB B-repeat-containing protein [[Clostridium] polysaccharolyticum]SET44261.1 Listeria/Bacterioides repeat-containing protein [[Clostridium] polysaccharolyticum]
MKKRIRWKTITFLIVVFCLFGSNLGRLPDTVAMVKADSDTEESLESVYLQETAGEAGSETKGEPTVDIEDPNAGDVLDYSRLQMEVDIAAMYLANEEFLEPYTEESVAVYRLAYEGAKSILRERKAGSQEEIDEASRALVHAYEFLFRKVLSVTFDTKTEEISIDGQRVVYGEKAKQPAVPERTGCTFKGWYQDKACTIEYNFDEPVKTDLVLYARWSVFSAKLEEAIRYAEKVLQDEDFIIAYTEESIEIYREILEYVKELVAQERIQTMEEAQDCETVLKNPEEAMNRKEIQILFMDGEECIGKQNVLYGDRIGYYTLEKSGYLFAGWFMSPDGTEKFDFDRIIRKEYVLYARWNLDYSELEAATKSAEEKLNDPEFVAPYTKESLEKYQEVLKEAQNVLWKRNAQSPEEIQELIERLGQAREDLVNKVFTVTFVSDDGTVLGTQEVEYGETATLPEPPEKEEYLFDGWYIDGNYNTAFDFEIEIWMDTILYAKWKVDYSSLEESIAHAKERLAKEEEMAKYTEESVKNYQLITEKAENMLTEESALSAEEINAMIKALEKAEQDLKVKVFHIVLDSNGGTDFAIQNVSYGETVEQPENPEREGYVFMEWCKDETLEEPYAFETEVTEPMVLYAKWEVDYAPLEKALEHAAELLSNKEELEIYEERTVKRLERAYTQAQMVYEEQSAHTAMKVAVLVSELEHAESALGIKECMVTFQTNGGSGIPDQKVKYGEKAVRPEDPEKEGYLFRGWYQEKTCQTVYDFETPVKGRIMLYAKWGISYDGLSEAVQHANELIQSEDMAAYTKVSVDNYKAIIKEATDMIEQDTALTAEDVTVLIATLQEPQKVLAKKVLEITFDSNGGTEIPVQKITYGEQVTRPEDPVKVGYLFEDWYENGTFAELYDMNAEVTKGRILYAKWALDYSELQKVLEEVRQDLESVDFTTGKIQADLENCLQICEKAEQMCTNKTATSIEQILGMIEELKLAKNRLSGKKLTVKFDSQGGTPVTDCTVFYGSAVKAPAVPEKEGYVFAGWYKDEQLAQKYDFASLVESELTLYAKWEIDYRQLELAVSKAKENLQNSAFVEKYEAASINEYQKTIQEAEQILNSQSCQTPQEVTDLVNTLRNPELKLVCFTVSFISNGDSDIIEQTVEYNSCAVKPEGVEKAGYVLEGWYVDQSYQKAYDFTTWVRSDIRLYAKWALDYRKLSWEVSISDSSVPQKDECYYKEEFWSVYKEAYRKARTMLAERNAKTKEEVEKLVNELKQAREKLEKEYLTVKFDSQGGTEVKDQTVVSGQMAIEPDTPEKESYVFAGWYVDQECSQRYDFDTKVTKDMTLYARWELNSFEQLKAMADVIKAQKESGEFEKMYKNDKAMKSFERTWKRIVEFLEEDDVDLEDAQDWLEELEEKLENLTRIGSN